MELYVRRRVTLSVKVALNKIDKNSNSYFFYMCRNTAATLLLKKIKKIFMLLLQW